MSRIQELTAIYEEQADSNIGFSLDDINAELEQNPGACWKSVLVKRKNYVLSVLKEQSLITWLEENSIPEWQWGGFYWDGDTIKYSEDRISNNG